MIRKTRFFHGRIGFLVLGVLSLSGCMDYQLGSMLPPGIRTVYIPTIVNKTGEPLLEAEATRALIERIQMDGSLRLAHEGSADALLHVTLRTYTMQGISFERGPTGRPNEYRVRLTASLSLVNVQTGEILAEHPSARGEATVESGGNVSAARRNAVPDAAEDLARDIVRRIVEYW